MKAPISLSLFTTLCLFLITMACGRAENHNDQILGKWLIKGPDLLGSDMCSAEVELQPDQKFELMIVNENTKGKTHLQMSGTYSFLTPSEIELTSKTAKCVRIGADGNVAARTEAGENDPLQTRLQVVEGSRLFFQNVTLTKPETFWAISFPKHRELTKVLPGK